MDDEAGNDEGEGDACCDESRMHGPSMPDLDVSAGAGGRSMARKGGFRFVSHRWRTFETWINLSPPVHSSG